LYSEEETFSPFLDLIDYKILIAMKITSLLFLIIIFSFITVHYANLTSLDVSVWTPDLVVKKHDPFDLISSNFGQPSGTYNFNNSEWTLLGRNRTFCNNCTEGGKHVIVKGNILIILVYLIKGIDLKIYVNDSEFWIKGMCYNPVPLGAQFMNANSGYLNGNGGGLCSVRVTPYNETKSACFDS
jgi:hypothetical protein